MISRASSFLGPKSIFNLGSGGTPSLVLSLDAAGYTSSGLWSDLTKLNNDGISDGPVSWSSEGGGSFDFDGSSAYFFFGKSNYTFNPSTSSTYGVTFSSNSVTSVEPDGNWDTKQSVSSESYSGGVRLKFQTGGPNPGFLMCGLSESPYDPIDNYSKPNYGFYVQGSNFLTIVEDNNFNVNPMVGTYSDTTNYIIIWDGTEVKYYVDEVLVYTSTTTPTNPLYLYCTFLNSELTINNIEFGPYVQGIPIGNSPYAQGIPVGNSPYTMEAWFKSDSFEPSEQGTLIGWGASEQMYKSNVLRLNANGLTNYWWGDDISVSFSGTSSMYVDNWYYVAATYDGTTRRLYLNGNLVQSDTPSAPLEVDDIQSLKVGYSYVNYFNGKISKVKVHSRALQDSRILSNFNTDKVRHGYVFGSMTFDAASYSYAYSTLPDYVLGTNDFTLEAFFYCATYSSISGIVSMRDDLEQGIAINLTSTGNLRFMLNAQEENWTGTISTDRWYHVALSRSGGTTSCYINGDFYHEFSGNINDYNFTGQDLVIGRYYTNQNDYFFNGVISNVRLINGVGLYSGTASFEIPNIPLESSNETELLIISQQTSPTLDVSGGLHVVTSNNIGWTSSLPFFFEGLIEFEFLDFSSTAGLVTQGDEVTVTSNYLYLTPATNNRTGNVFTSTSTNYNRSFTLTWNFECGNGSGADGFCVQWTTINNTFGLGGGGVGRISDASTIVAISFQTYNGNLIYSHNAIDVGVYNVGITFRQNLYYWLDYNHVTSTIEIFWNSTNTKPGGSPNVTQNSVVFDSSNYYFGFGAATGGLNDQHILKSMKLIFT